MKVLRWIFGVVIVITLAPLIFMLVSGLVGALAGCQVDEGTARACHVFGADVGELLYAGTTSAWYAMVTAPIGVLVAAVWIVIEIVLAIRRGLRKRAAA